MSNILIVDDDQLMRFLLHRILTENEEYEVSEVSSGQEALDFLSENAVDLIMLDILMPEMDGFETIRRIREIPRYADVPVLFLTGDRSSDKEIEALSLGGWDFIVKPFRPEVVRLRVSHILELYHLRNDLSAEVDKKTRKLKEARDQLEAMSLEIIQTLSGTIDAKDEYTNGHSHRVAEYSQEIARRYGYTPEEQMKIYLIGLLHDIGKIGVPDEILRMPRRLTDEEFAVIKNHPAIGAEILSNITTMPDISSGAHWHHERYDGNGYPDGLKGDDIPEVARIIAVADAYDAMTSNRSYRNHLPQETVRAEIEKGSGTQFDPRFAGIMLQMIDEDKGYRMQDDSTPDEKGGA